MIFSIRNQDRQEEMMKQELVKASKRYNREELFALRTKLIMAIDPLHAASTDLHDEIMKCLRTAIGEKTGHFDQHAGVRGT